MLKKNDLLKKEILHFDIKSFDARALVSQFESMAFQARNIARASKIYDRMISDEDCTIILTLAGSLFSAGLKRIVFDMIENNMVDVIVSTGAIIIDQDFFEALGFKHYQGTPFANDSELMKKRIDRIYDTFINEDDLRVCDTTIRKIADNISPGTYSSQEFINILGKYLKERNIGDDSVVRLAHEKGLPIFVPAFSDSSAGFGLVEHQFKRNNSSKVAIDSVKDFLDLTKIKINSKETGLFIIGGGVPKNFAQDITVAGEIIADTVNMHKYAVQITVADERDGGLSGSTLKEAHSWGKVDEDFEQMVFSEATIAFPIIVSYAYHRGSWKHRTMRKFNV